MKQQSIMNVLFNTYLVGCLSLNPSLLKSSSGHISVVVGLLQPPIITRPLLDTVETVQESEGAMGDPSATCLGTAQPGQSLGTKLANNPDLLVNGSKARETNKRLSDQINLFCS